MALSRPKGSATNMDSTAVRKVALTRAKTPKCLDWNRGVQRVPVMNSMKETSPKNWRAWKRRTKTMPAVVRMDIKVHIHITATIIRSGSILRQLARSSRPDSPIPIPSRE